MQLIVAVLLCSLAISSADVDPITVKGSQILFGGKPGSIAGNSLFWTDNGWGGEKFYNKNLVKWLKTDWKSKLIRAAMGVEDAGGYLQDAASNKARVKTVVDAAIENDIYVIIDWHSHFASQHQAEAIAFFQEMAKTYGDKNNVIYEIWNEPKDVQWKDTIKPYAEAVIKAIREIDPDNLIIVGTSTWSQDVDIAAADPITGYENIAYTLHYYAGSHGQDLRNKAENALSKNIALFVTEWGAVNADGNGGVATQESNNWADFLKKNKLSNANWSINDKPEGASALKPGASPDGGWSEGDLTDSGKYVRALIQNWSS